MRSMRTKMKTSVAVSATTAGHEFTWVKVLLDPRVTEKLTGSWKNFERDSVVKNQTHLPKERHVVLSSFFVMGGSACRIYVYFFKGDARGKVLYKL